VNKKNKHTLAAIFEEPVRSNIHWKDIEALLVAMGAEVTAVFHRPHPEKETDKGAIKSIRRFLIQANIMNDVEEFIKKYGSN
jgi:hypothetical protein